MLLLRQSGITQVIDVRERAISRKKGFSKDPLGQGLLKEGVLYQHIPELGTPLAVRGARKSGGSLGQLLKEYTRHLGKNEKAYKLLSTLIETKASAILCFERDYANCHRQVLAGKLEKDGFRVTHI